MKFAKEIVFHPPVIRENDSDLQYEKAINSPQFQLQPKMILLYKKSPSLKQCNHFCNFSKVQALPNYNLKAL